jgi:tRNA(Ile)-lysidine synthase
VNQKPPGKDHRKNLSQRLEDLIITHDLLADGDAVVVGVSAGSDSIALLHLLAKATIPLRLFAVYVDHGLRPDETDHEFAVVCALCNQMGIPAERVVVDVYGERKRRGTSLEDAARTMRYRALEAARKAHGAAAVAVAHTADDQAEEVLIRLIRGSGRMGLSGMALRRGTIIRPLLHEKKQTLIDYLEENAIASCLDSSNRQSIFLRNRIRLDLLPYLERHYNSAIRRTLLQTAEILAGEEDLLDRLAGQKFDELTHLDNATCPAMIKVPIQPLLSCHPALQRRILEKACWMLSTRPEFRQIEQIRHLAACSDNGAQLHLTLGARIRKTGGELIFSHPSGRIAFRGDVLKKTPVSLMVPGPGVFVVAEHILTVSLLRECPKKRPDTTLLLDGEKVIFPLHLRPPLPGERFRPLGAPGRKKVHRFLTDAKIPREDRQAFPVLLAGERILAVAGLRIEHDFRITKDTVSYLLIDWRKA